MSPPHSARPRRLGSALAWAGWGAIAAQRFSAGLHALVFGVVLAGVGVLLVVLMRIQERRAPEDTASAGARLAAAPRAKEPFESRLFRELTPEIASDRRAEKN